MADKPEEINRKPKDAWTWRHGILESDLPATTRHVLLTLSCHLNDVGDGCYPSIALLVRETGLSNRSVIDNISAAEKAGWIVKRQHGFRGKKWKRNEYFPRWPERNLTAEGGEPASLPHGEPGSLPLDQGGEPSSLQGGEPPSIKVVKEVHSNCPLEHSTSLSPNACAREDDARCEYLEDNLRARYGSGVSDFIDRCWLGIPGRPKGVQHWKPFISEMAKQLSKFGNADLELAAEACIADRSVFPSASQAVEYCSAAKAQSDAEGRRAEATTSVSRTDKARWDRALAWASHEGDDRMVEILSRRVEPPKSVADMRKNTGTRFAEVPLRWVENPAPSEGEAA